ncbi:MAG: AsmA family protein [Bacteroidetes bacterium]|nr:MAG: AsmA family protein [Bacteroidota bacterium]
MLKSILKYIGFIFLGLIILLFSILGLAYFYRNRIVELFVNQANKYISAKILVDKINLEFWETFPYISLEFQNIRIKESIPKSDSNFAEAKKLYVSLSLQDIINQKIRVKQIVLKDGMMNFKLLKNGQNNFTLLKTNTDSTANSTIVFDLSDIKLSNMNLKYMDEDSDNQYDIKIISSEADFHFVNSNWDINLNADVVSNQLKFNKLPFFKNTPMKIKSSIKYIEENEKYIINPSQIDVSNAIFNLTGFVTLDNKPYVDLKFSEKNSDIKTMLSLIPEKISKPLERYKSNGNVYFNGIVKGYFNRGNKPLVEMKFGCKNAQFNHPDYDISIKNAGFLGEYSNGMGEKKSISYFSLKNIHATFEDKDLDGEMKLNNLNEPELDFKIKTTKYFPQESIESAEGLVGINLTFSGKTDEIKNKIYTSVSSSGDINLQNTTIKLKNKDWVFNELNGEFLFDNTDISIKELRCNAGKSDIKFIGTLKNIIPFFTHNNQNLNLIASLESEKMFLDELIFSKTATDSKLKIDFPENIALDFKAKIKNFYYKKIYAQNCQTHLMYENKKLILDDVAFDFANGKMKMKSSLVQKVDSTIDLQTVFDVQHAEIDSVLAMNDNFGQTFITNKILKGELTAQLKINFSMSNTGIIKKQSVNADINMSIKNGKLYQFEPLKKLSKFVNEEALTEVRFSELKNDFKIYNQTVFIPEMTIKSNITTMQIRGTHGFDNQFEYKLKVPLRNYRKKENLEDENAVENDGKGGLNLYLKIAGNPDDFKVSYDGKAVRQHIKERWQEEKKQFLQLFKKDYEIKKQEKEKNIGLKEDEFLDL